MTSEYKKRHHLNDIDTNTNLMLRMGGPLAIQRPSLFNFFVLVVMVLIGHSSSYAGSVPVLDVARINELIAKVPSGQDTVYIDDMGFKVSYLLQLRDQLLGLQGPSPSGSVSSAAPTNITQWPGGVVPYTFHSSVTTTQRGQWRAACDEWEKFAKLSFVERTTQGNYITVHTTSNVNNSYMGVQGGSQILNMASWSWKYIICHEIAHALGVCHEQSRSDRDTYVTINTTNIEPLKTHNFDKETTHNRTPYDFGSVMHYDRNAFAINGGIDTITPKPGFEASASNMGQRSKLSVYDKQGVAVMYGGPDMHFANPAGWTTGVALSNTTNTNIHQTVFSDSDTLYLDVAVGNDGVIAIPSACGMKVYINGTEKFNRPIAAGLGSKTWSNGHLDLNLGKLSMGSHQIRVVLDALNEIGEVDETVSSNERQMTINVTATVVPTVSTTSPSGVTLNSAVTGGNVINSGGAQVTERGVIYSTSNNPTVTTGVKVVSGSGTGSFTSTLSGLSPSTQYFVRAYAINSVGPGYGASLSLPTLAVPPTVTAISPTGGVVSGGTQVTITGTNFTGVTGVSFGGAAASFVTNGGTSITAVSPARSSVGPVMVTVSNTGGSATAVNSFNYTAATPRVNQSSANLLTSATTLLITGSHFSPMASNNSITFLPSGSGTITAATADSLTVSGLAGLSQGSLNAVVTSHGVSSGTPVQVAMVVAPGPGDATGLNANVVGGYVLATAIQPDGKVILAGAFSSVLGQSRNNIARLNANGTLDTAFNPNANGDVNCIVLQTDGQILLGGSFTSLQPNGAATPTARNRIARLASTGALDASFDPNANSGVLCMAVQPNGQILLGGTFTSLQPNGAVTPTSRNYIARLATNGTVDTTFDPNPNHFVFSLALYGDGQILLGGSFTHLRPNGGFVSSLRNYFARVLASGALDVSYYAHANNVVYCIAIQADARVLVGGAYTQIGGVARNGLTRLAVNGEVEGAFDPNANGPVYSLTEQADGRILVGGQFTAIGGIVRNRIARLAANGTLEKAYNPNANGDVLSIAVDNEGKTWIGGTFSSVGQASRSRFAQLLDAPVTQALSTVGTSQLLWSRGGTGPEVTQVTFELSTNGGVSYTPLPGAAGRLVNTAHWQLSGLSLPTVGQIRVRGRAAGGRSNGSSGIIEQIASYQYPTVTSISPTSGTTAGGTQVLITGTNFSETRNVTFGGIPASDFDVISSTQISATTPARFAGTASVVVTAASGTNTANTLYTYAAVAPTITASTTNIPTTATTLLITGTNFSPIPSQNVVTFSPSGTGVVSAVVPITSTTMYLKVSGLSGLNVGPLNAVVTSNGLSSGTAVRVATVVAPGPGHADPLKTNITGYYVLATAVQPDGKIIIGGSFESVLGVTRSNIARLNADGTLDSAFNPTVNGEVTCIAVQADGRILLGGAFTNLSGAPINRLARVTASGQLDTTFNPNIGNRVYSILIQADGRILIGGSFSTVGGVARNNLARVTENGVLDASFNPNPNGQVFCLAEQANGQILLGGSFTAIGATGRNRIARMAVNGALDTSFDPNADGLIYCLAVQPNEQILLGGSFRNVAGTARNRIARIAANGTLDTTFNPNADGPINSIALQADGQILLSGWYDNLAGSVRNGIARWAVNNTLDANFDPNADFDVYCLAVQSRGGVLVGGTFDSLGGVERSRFARLLNGTASQTLSSVGSTQVLWSRGGSAPELTQAAFELSTDGGFTFTRLGGTATRVGTTANWQLTGLSLPANGLLRARGRTAGGYQNGSSGLVEQVASFGLSLAPVITGVSPSSGRVSGGTSVTITGSNLTTVTSVSFGGSPASHFVVNSPTQITAITPAFGAASVNVQVNSPGGTSTPNLFYSYLNSTPPTNDNFTNRGVLASDKTLTITANTTGATKQVGEPNHWSGNGGAGGASIWWSWTAPFSGNFSISTSGSDFDTLLAVYAGSAVNALTLVANNDDDSGTNESFVNFNAVAGGTYQIAVDGHGGQSGAVSLTILYPAPTVTSMTPASGGTLGGTNVTLYGTAFSGVTEVTLGGLAATNVTVVSPSQITATTPARPAGNASVRVATPSGVSPTNSLFTYFNVAPVNDHFSQRILLANEASAIATGNNLVASKQGGEPNHWTGPGGQGGASVWWSWTAPFSASYTVNTHGSGFDTFLAVYTGSAVNALTLVANNDDAHASHTSQLIFEATAGVTYHLAVDGYNGATGAIRLSIILPEPTVTAVSPNSGSSQGGTSVTITGTNLSGITSLRFGDAEATQVTVVNSSTITAVTPARSAGSVSVRATTPGGTSADNALFTYFNPIPGNDLFGNRVLLTGSSSLAATGSNLWATKQAGEPNHWSGTGGASVWWSWTAPFSGSFSIDTFGSSFDTLLSVYTGIEVTHLTLVGNNHDAQGGSQSQVTFNAIEGVNYQIAVDGFDGQTGVVNLAIVYPHPSVKESSGYVISTAATLTLTGSHFSITPSGNSVVLSPSGTGIVTAATATSLTLTSVSGLTVGDLSAVVTSHGLASRAPVRIGVVVSPETMNRLELSPEIHRVSRLGEEKSFTVTSLGDWSWQKSPGSSWITTGEMIEQNGNQTFSYSVAPNTGLLPRTARFDLVRGPSKKSHTIVQAGRNGAADELKLLELVRIVPPPLTTTPDQAGVLSLTALPSGHAAALTKELRPQTAGVLMGTNLRLTATAKTGFLFSHWIGVPNEATILGDVVTFVMPAEDVTGLTAVFVVNPFIHTSAGDSEVVPRGISPVFRGLLWPDPETAPSNNHVGQIVATLVPSTGRLSGAIWMGGLLTPFVGILQGDGSVLFRVKRLVVHSLSLPFGKSLSMTWGVSGLSVSVASPNGDGSSGEARLSGYSSTRIVSLSLLNEWSKRGYYTMALLAKAQQPIKDITTYPQGTGLATLTLSRAGTLNLAGLLADGTKVTGSSFLMADNNSPIFVSMVNPGGKTKASSLMGTLKFDDIQEDSDVSSDDMTWFRGTAETKLTKTQSYRAGWPEGINLDVKGALYENTYPLHLTLDLTDPDPIHGNAELSFASGKLSTPLAVRALNIHYNSVAKIPVRNPNFTLMVSPKTGMIKGSFRPDWFTPSVKSQPAFNGIVLQKGASRGGYGYFMSNILLDLNPESGKVILNRPQ